MNQARWQKMVLTLLMVGILPVFMAGGVFLLNFQASLHQQVEGQLDAIATIQQGRTDNLIEHNQEILASVTSQLPLSAVIKRYISSRSSSDLTLIQKSLAATQAGVKSFQAISILSPQGVRHRPRGVRDHQQAADDGAGHVAAADEGDRRWG